ncbi:MAG: YciI family protein [Cyanobacteria bacterium]|nr:YciI family protein [Cyanobacteriota bacterium]MEB3267739.1 YciI family protein [Leptolyngbya sp.]
MQYAILVYETEQDFRDRPTHMAAYNAYSQALAAAGVAAGGAALHPSHTATTVRLQGDKRQVQDGPYADTKEQLGGLFIIDVADLDAALDWAARCPAASLCAVEVRPLLPMA